MKPLFDIGTDLLALNALLEESGGEVGPESEEAINVWFQELESNESQKLDNYVGLIRTLEMEAAAARAEAEQFQKKAKTREARIDWLKRLMKEHLMRTGRQKVTTASNRTISIQGNGGSIPIVPEDWHAADIKDVPVELRKTVIDAAAVRKHLEAGGELVFARLGERGTQLRIR